jgi:hypothetical protein
MNRIALILAATLGGCATVENGTFERMSREIAAQQAEIIRLKAAKPTPAPAPAVVAPPVVATPAPTLPTPPLPTVVAPAPAVASPTAVIPAVYSPFPDQRTAYMSRAPNGWGASPLSLLFKNNVERRIPGETYRENYCWTGLEIDNEQAIVVQPSSAAGALPRMYQVKEGPTVRTATLVPPGGSARVLMNEPGHHHFRVRCYIGPPRMTTINTPAGPMTVPVLQLYSEWEGDATNPQSIVADEWHLTPVPDGRFE